MIDDYTIENNEFLKSPESFEFSLKLEYGYAYITIVLYLKDIPPHEVLHFSTFYSIIDGDHT